MAQKVYETDNFVFVHLIEQDYARQDKIDLAWERISHEMESGLCARAHVCVLVIIKTCNSIQIQNRFAKALQTK
jgi:hypothetical protein